MYDTIREKLATKFKYKLSKVMKKFVLTYGSENQR